MYKTIKMTPRGREKKKLKKHKGEGQSFPKIYFNAFIDSFIKYKKMPPLLFIFANTIVFHCMLSIFS